MQSTVSRYPGQFSNQKPSMEKGRVTVSEGDQLSPVDLTTSAATPLSLPSLQWSHYDSKPEAVYARNIGVTVMIQASFRGEVPFLSSGPLTEKYNLYQIHFHWGEHDETGSGHSVDGVRFPLEMHVVHVKKECSNLIQASGTKDGIAIAVHLFSLREERNTDLDQLMAVLQFIQKPNCCAKLYPSSLSEIVHPFSKDYFLYWGAVPGPSKQHYRIVWLVSRNILPVSAQQIGQFRDLRDVKGNYIWANSNDPYPLGDRSLFLVSPSKKTNESIFGIPKKRFNKMGTSVKSDESIEIRDAEFKSLIALEEIEAGSCAICPHPKHAGYDSIQTPKCKVKIIQGQTSIEESCINLESSQKPTAVVKKEFELQNKDQKLPNSTIKITACGNSCSPKYIPSQDMYSVISANEDEIHLKRKPLLVRKSDPSMEQACVFLTKTAPSVHAVKSEPSLTAWGYLGLKKECTDIPNPTQKCSDSFEINVLNRNMESEEIKKRVMVNENLVLSKKSNNNTKTGTLATHCNKEVAIQNSTNLNSFESKEDLLKSSKQPSLAVLKQSFHKEGEIENLKSEDKRLHSEQFYDNKFQTEYLLVKQTEPKKSFYKVVGELLITPDTKRTFVKRENYPNEERILEISNKVDNISKHSPGEKESSEKHDIMYKKIVLFFPSSREETNKIQTPENITCMQTKTNVENKNSKNISNVNSPYKVIEVQQPIKGNEKVRAGNDKSSKEYYVTKITPLVKSQQEKLEGIGGKKLYYAKPIYLMKEVDESSKGINNSSYIKGGVSHTPQYYSDKNGKHSIETQYDAEDIRELKKINLENLENPSDHLLMRKQLRNVLAQKNTDLFDQIEENKKDAKNIRTTESAPREQREITNNLNIKNTKGSSTSIKQQIEETLTREKKDSKINNLLNSMPKMQDLMNDTDVKDLHKFNLVNLFKKNNEEIMLEEELEEKTVYSSQKSKKKITIQVTDPTYKIKTSQAPIETRQSSSQHLVTVKKVEIPDPYYLKRVPRQLPLDEREVGVTWGFEVPHQQVESIETEEISSEVKTIKTSIKKSNRKIEDERIPLEMEKTKMEKTKDEKYDKYKSDDSIKEQLFKLENKNTKTINDRYINLNPHSEIKAENGNENCQQITIDLYHTNMSNGVDGSSQSLHDIKINKKKSTRVVIGPNEVNATEENITNMLSSKDRNLKPNTVEITIKTIHQEQIISDHKNQSANPSKNTSNKNSESDKNNLLMGKPVIDSGQNANFKFHEPVNLDLKSEQKRIYVDAATSNPSGFLLPTLKYSQDQPLQAINNTDTQEETTKDQGTDSPVGLDSPLKKNKECEKDMSSTKKQERIEESSSPSKDTLVYIHLPQSGAQSSSKQFIFKKTESVPTLNVKKHKGKGTEKKQETESEKLPSVSQKPSESRKTKSTNTYQPPTVSDISQEELISSHIYDSSEEEIIDSSHVNMSFKNEAKMELPNGLMAHMKSIAEVKFKSKSKSSHAYGAIGYGTRPSAKVTADQVTITVEDKCCSAIDFGNDIGNLNNDTSEDTSTRSEDELKENESAAINLSPIIIEKDQTLVKIFSSLQFIDHWNRGVNEEALLENKGTTVKASLPENAQPPILQGGPLEGDYVFAELHFHWGPKDCCGAEHIIDDQRRTMEAHFLYFKKEYESVREALLHVDGLAMVAIFLNAGGPPNPLFGQLIRNIARIREAGTGIHVPAASLFSWMKQTAEEAQGYFSYKGTMTTQAPYIEALTWIIFQTPITFCCTQSLEFRKLLSQNGELLLKTNRPPRPSNNRPVFYVPS